MSDNNAGALLISTMLANHVEAEMSYISDNLDDMEDEDKEKLVEVIQLRCFSHIRCLCANEGVNLENR